MRYFSMFSGIGGFELGIQRALDNRGDTEAPALAELRLQPDANLGNGNGGWTHPTCVGYSEIDKYADQIYQKHFGGKNYGDATKINAGELPDFDLLVGGFPCQAFSVAGKRLGFNETRGTLFFDIARILKDKRPRHFVLENVKGLLSHDSGRTFTTIIGVLTDLGYFVEWQVLNSKDFGVPQNRERVFIVGHLGNGCRGKVFPIFGENETNLGQNLTLIEDSARHKPRVYDKVSPTVQSSFGMGGGHVPLATRQPLRFLNRNQKNIEGDYAYTVDASQTSGVKQEQRIRRLTPLECERLQGFPDRWTEFGAIPGTDEAEIMSDTQRYKMCGNAVTVNVVQAVIERLIDHE